MDQQHSAVPHWIHQSYFMEIIKQSVPNCKHISNFDVRPALSAGENYGSLMLRLKIDILCEGELKRKLQGFTLTKRFYNILLTRSLWKFPFLHDEGTS